MALLFCDGFDHLAAANIATKWNSVVGNTTTEVTIASPGRLGTGSGVRIKSTSNAIASRFGLTKTLAANYTTLIVGFAYKLEVFPTGGSANIVAAFLDGASLQTELRCSNSGQLTVTRNNTLLGTCSSGISANTWVYIEMKVLFSDTVGTVDVRLNGVSVLALTAQDTKNTANAYANAVNIAGVANSSDTTAFANFDDFVVMDTSGSDMNTLLGDIGVFALYPDGAGNYSQFARGGADSGNNWDQVNDATSNADTDYVSDATVGHIDTYTFTNPNVTVATVKAVVTNLVARKDDVGSRTVGDVIRISSTDYVGADNALGDSYATLQTIHQTNPATSAAWTLSEVNALEAGHKVKA